MSSLVFPFHDPNNIEIKFLKQALSELKNNFDNAFISITPPTVTSNPKAVRFLQQDNFFVVNLNSKDSFIGDHFKNAYLNAVKNSNPDQILHLCTSDRLAYILLTDHKKAFLADTLRINKNDTPLLFLRSQKAWTTYPQNYYAAESMVTEMGKILFGKELDFTWCHLALSTQQLNRILPSLVARDLVITSQLILSLKEIIHTKKVDWLSWEDPFIFGKDPKQYKIKKEADPKELEKRMGYVLPEIKYLFEEYRKSLFKKD